MKKKRDIRALTKEELREFFIENNDQAFRGNQIYEWLWQKSTHSFDRAQQIRFPCRSQNPAAGIRAVLPPRQQFRDRYRLRPIPQSFSSS